MKLTKIIATIGPSCEEESIIEKLIVKGVDVFRFNFKHNTVAWHQKMIQRVRNVAHRLDLPIGTMIDLAGPEIRINMQYEEIRVSEGKEYSFGQNMEIAITHPEIYSHLHDGQKIVVDDGAFHFTLKKKGKKFSLVSHSEGVLKNKKTLNIPGADFPVELLVDRDLEGLRLAQEYNIDFIALSFIRTAQDIEFLKEQMQKLHLTAKIVAKIETQKAITNLKKIVSASDIVMVARGDLGVEFPFEQVPYYQKQIIRTCLEQGVPVITATQILESMIENPYPTRAEISDVANATFDLTDAVMLSAESAIGRYPSKAVATMSKAVTFSEKITIDDIRLRYTFDVDSQAELLCDSAYNLYYTYSHKKGISAFVVLTQTGKTARTLSRYRPHIPIFAFAPDKAAATGMSINFGVYPFLTPWRDKARKEVTGHDIERAVAMLTEKDHLKKGQKVIAIYGRAWEVAGGPTTIRIVTV